MMPIFESLVHLLVVVVAYVHWRNRPLFQHVNRMIFTDPRLGQIGAAKHFNSPTKNCFDYGCTDDCPVSRSTR